MLETNQRLDNFEGMMAEALDLLVKTQQGLTEEVRKLPQGRRSIARVNPNGLPLAVGHPETGDVEKTAEEQLAAHPIS